MVDLQSGHAFIIAEMANAHEGVPSTAKALVEAAAAAGADAIKFQVFKPDELAVPSFSNYGLYQRLQMSHQDWQGLVAFAHERGLTVFSDVFGTESGDLMSTLGVDGFKIHAADVSNAQLLAQVAATGKPILLSVGGSTWVETADALSILRSAGAATIVLMHGFQSYPTKLSHSFLRRVQLLRTKFGIAVGFASHVDGATPEAIDLPVWAVAAGSDLVEVHITLDRSLKGSDYFSSLEPEQFSRLVRSIRETEPVLGDYSLRMSDDELKYRAEHKKQLVATRDISPGDILNSENVALKRVDDVPPGRPLSLDFALGRQVANPILAHSPIRLKDLRMKTAAILACRVESTRLYGKPMQLVGDRPIIQHLVDRLRQVKLLDEIVLAISEGPGRNVFIDYAEKKGLPYVIGPEKDVLGRLIMAADHIQADLVLRTTTENPYIYWENLDDLIRQHVEQNADLTVTEKLPLGAFVEILSLDALKKSHKHGEDRHRSELCTLFIAENPDIFKVHRVSAPERLQHPDFRLTVDTPQDLILVRTLWQQLHRDGCLISIEEIVDCLVAHPEMMVIDSGETTLYLWK